MNETAEGRAAIRESKFGHLTVGTIMETQVQSATKDTKAEDVSVLYDGRVRVRTYCR